MEGSRCKTIATYLIRLAMQAIGFLRFPLNLWSPQKLFSNHSWWCASILLANKNQLLVKKWTHRGGVMQMRGDVLFLCCGMDCTSGAPYIDGILGTNEYLPEPQHIWVGPTMLSDPNSALIEILLTLQDIAPSRYKGLYFIFHHVRSHECHRYGYCITTAWFCSCVLAILCAHIYYAHICWNGWLANRALLFSGPRPRCFTDPWYDTKATHIWSERNSKQDSR